MEESINIVSNINSTLQYKIDMLTKENMQYNQLIISLENEIENNKNKVNYLENEINRLKETIEKINRDNTELNKKIINNQSYVSSIYSYFTGY
jgi:chromosome segregation ATPase